MRNGILNTLGLGLLAATLVTAAQAQEDRLIYSTSFETSEGYTLGALPQNSWAVEGANGASVVDTPLSAPDGSNYVLQNADTTVSRDIVDQDATQVIFRAHYYGEGSENLQPPARSARQAGDPALIIGFEKVDANNVSVSVYDNNTQNWLSSGLNLANDQFHVITALLDYSTQKVYMSVNNQAIPAFQNIDFSNPVSNINGFNSMTDTGLSFDGVIVMATDGDADNDGESDIDELTTNGADPLETLVPYDWAAKADFDKNRCTDLNDFLTLLDNWQGTYDTITVDLNVFLALLDNWQTGPGC